LFPGIPLFHSVDLVNWHQIGHCLTRKSQVDLDNFSTCAATLRFHNDRFYVTTQNAHEVNYIYTSPDPAGPWSDPLVVEQTGIDPSLFFDDDGKVFFTTTLPGVYGGIQQSEIDIQTGACIVAPRLLWKGTGGAWPEGPHMYKINGYYYLLLAEGGTEYGHMVTLARGADPWGPFEPCPRNPIATHRSTYHPIQAVGHGDLIYDRNNRWWMVCLGIRPLRYPRFHVLGRETFLVPVEWDKHGWPVVGNNGMVEETVSVEGLPGLGEQTDHSFFEDFEQKQLDCRWQHVKHPDRSCYSLSARPGSLMLKGSVQDLDSEGSPTFLGFRQKHHCCSAETRVEFRAPDELSEAGFTVYARKGHHYDLCCTKRRGAFGVLLRRRIGSLVKEENFLETEPGAVTLRIETDSDTYRFSFCSERPGHKGHYSSVGAGECRYVSKEVAGRYSGVLFGLYSVSRGSHDVAAFFDWVRYTGQPNSEHGRD
jgi:alpha-N-arabinofuranosidase